MRVALPRVVIGAQPTKGDDEVGIGCLEQPTHTHVN
jgi:hypothetical protein